MAITSQQFFNYNFWKLIFGIIGILVFLVLIFGCKQEWHPLKDMNCNPCIVTDIDSFDEKEPIITIIDSSGKVQRIISIEFARTHTINDSIWENQLIIK